MRRDGLPPGYDNWKATEPPPQHDDEHEEPQRCSGCGANLDEDEDCRDDCPEHLEREADAERETNAEVARDYRSRRFL
jgi:hypothetical protein